MAWQAESIVQMADLSPFQNVPTVEQQQQFLELVAGGERRDHAARIVGTTATRFRRLAKREPEFAARYADAISEYESEFADRLRAELEERAFDRDDKASDRLLLALSEALLPIFEHKRSRKIVHGQDGPFQIQAVPWIDAAKLEALPEHEIIAFFATIDKIRSDPPALEVET